MITLTKPAPHLQISIDSTLISRRTAREFEDRPISLDAVGHLLFAGQGEIGNRRTAPSAGALYPLRLLIAARAVDGLDPGLYAYRSGEHGLEPIRPGDISGALRDAALEEQPWIGEAAAVIAIVADTGAARTTFHEQPPEGRRGERYVYIEAGAIAQNMHLEATVLKLGAVLVAGFDDGPAAQALGLEENFDPVILFCVGSPKSAS